MRKMLVLLVLITAVHISPAVAMGSEVFYGLKVTTPQQVCGSIAWIFGEGVIIQAEPGLSGGKLQMGIFRGTHSIFAAAKLSALRTWFDPVEIEPDQTYLGVEFEVAQGLQYNFNLGLYGHVQGDDDENDLVVSAGIGIGF